MGEGSGALKIHSRADAANRVAVYGVRHVTVSPRSYIVWRTEVVQRFLIKETRPLEAFALRGLFCWGDIMKCSFDSTGTLGTLYEAAVVFVAMSVSLFLISIGDYYRFSTLMAVSAIIFIVFAVAAVVLLNIKGGVIYAKSEKLIITHSLASRKILVSRISYEDIEYADHNVTQKRSRLGFYCYVFELIIHMKSGKKIKLCVDLNIPEDKPMCDPDGYKRFISDQPIMKLCRYINEKSR